MNITKAMVHNFNLSVKFVDKLQDLYTVKDRVSEILNNAYDNCVIKSEEFLNLEQIEKDLKKKIDDINSLMGCE